MESQLKLLQEQSESKQDTRKALKIISELQEMIPTLGIKKYNWGDFEIVPQRFLELLHDSEQSRIIWDVQSYRLFGKSIGDGKGPIKEQVRNFEAFKNLFEEMVLDPESSFVIYYVSTPKICLDPDNEVDKIQVKDYLMEVHALEKIWKNLKGVEKVVNMYDTSIVADLHGIYNKELGAFYEVFLKNKQIEINSKIKTKDMRNYLLKFIAFDTWQKCIKELKDDIRPRLLEVMRHLQESS